MCIICISEKGVVQPTTEQIVNMWNRNPHGAGYMYYRDGKVIVHKGYMNLETFIQAVDEERFTSDDVVVYHFRISTQGGVNPEMTQPFFFTKNLEDTVILDKETKLGIAHNGIIPMTTDSKDKKYSDTAHFISEYLPNIVRNRKDLANPNVQTILAELLNSKMVFLDFTGNITKIGRFITEDNGLIFSNSSYLDSYYNYKAVSKKNYSFA